MLADCSAWATGPHSWAAKNEDGVGQEEDLEENGGWRRSAGGGVGGGSRTKEEEQADTGAGEGEGEEHQHLGFGHAA